MTYQVKTIDTTHVQLTDDILELTELLAKNVHEHWASQRLLEGWTYGPSRNDQRKETPVLVPFEQLPESEKEYDRKTALETLNAIIALGYSIKKI
ncbi:MAG: RyR domain-containing protein [Syntrophomonas sp.]